jgi:hypothetical protein
MSAQLFEPMDLQSGTNTVQRASLLFFINLNDRSVFGASA